MLKVGYKTLTEVKLILSSYKLSTTERSLWCSLWCSHFFAMILRGLGKAKRERERRMGHCYKNMVHLPWPRADTLAERLVMWARFTWHQMTTKYHGPTIWVHFGLKLKFLSWDLKKKPEKLIFKFILYLFISINYLKWECIFNTTVF